MLTLTSNEIVEQLQVVQQAQEILRSIIKQVQLSCTHQHIAEYRSGIKEPARICLHCGMTEDSWGCGHIVLINRTSLGLPTVNSDQFYKLRQGIHINDEIKGKLLRKEITLDVL